MQKPKTSRITAQLGGEIQTNWSRTMHEAIDARLAKTRMCPTPESHRTTTGGPSRKPPK